MKVKRESEVAQSCPTLSNPMGFSRQEYWSGLPLPSPVVGNLSMIIIIKVNSKLHTIMYFFLSHLSFVDFCFSTVVIPKLLENLILEDRTISFSGCIAQFCFACLFGLAETFMLAAMAYDCFVAVCNPLLYATAMSP